MHKSWIKRAARALDLLPFAGEQIKRARRASDPHKSMAQLHAENERDKNTLYADRIKQIEKSVFHALIFNTYGGRDCEASEFSCYINNLYRGDAELFVANSEETVRSCEGTTQGGSESGGFYACGTVPIVDKPLTK